MSELFETKTKTFGYFINLDERGQFNADLRDFDNNTLMTVTNEEQDDDGNELYGEIGLVEAGYMKHGRDLSGLADYAIQMGLIPAGSTVLASNDFERKQEEVWEQWQECVDVLDSVDAEQLVGALYNDNEEVADALDKLINDFSLEQWGGVTIGHIKNLATGQGVEQQASASSSMRMG